LQAEHEAAEREYLAEMPCQLLLRAGRELLGRRTRSRALMGRARKMVVEIGRELEMLQQALGAGAWGAEKDTAEKEFLEASKRAKKVRTRLSRATVDSTVE